MASVESPLGAVVFDVNETLFDLEGLRPAFVGAGLDPGALQLWFARVLRDGFALAALGEHRPFAEIAAAALRGLEPTRSLEAAVDGVLAAFRQLGAHPDVEPAFRRLREAGLTVMTLTNGSSDVTRALLSRANLTSYVDQVLSVDDVQRWKPAPEPYLHAAARAGLAPHRVALVAAHGWDVHGARRAGLRTGWVSRLERIRPAVFDAADVEGDDLVEVVEGLLALG